MEDTAEWLMQGDPAIRWQVLRDLRDAPEGVWQAERALMAQSGWARRLLELQGADGRWTAKRGPSGFRGLYSPKWTSTTYTLLMLRRLGLEPGHPGAIRGCQALLDGSQWFSDGSVAPWKSKKTDTCVCGLFLGIFEWFDVQSPARRHGLTHFLLAQQKADGGWNCRPSEVSSMHSTVSALEGLALRAARHPSGDLDDAMAAGREYLLQRRLFRGRRSGEIIQPAFKLFSFPPRWKYDVLRALEHFQDVRAAGDVRLEEAIELLKSKRRADGTWPLQNRHSGESHFQMEKPGRPSRWNTLRALRVLRWWEEMPRTA